MKQTEKEIADELRGLHFIMHTGKAESALTRAADALESKGEKNMTQKNEQQDMTDKEARELLAKYDLDPKEMIDRYLESPSEDLPELEPCPICGCKAAFEHSRELISGDTIVKVRCSIGCVAQIIFHGNEGQAAAAWNFRQPTERSALQLFLAENPSYVEQEPVTVTWTGYTDEEGSDKQ